MLAQLELPIENTLSIHKMSDPNLALSDANLFYSSLHAT
jgi:hypothetical protein